jgi:hypothetical protein
VTPTEERLYRLVTASTAPVWLAMIVAPRSPVTAQVVRLAGSLQVGLGAGYVALLAASVAAPAADGGPKPKVSFMVGDSVRRGLMEPRGFLAAWSHMVTLDLVTGRQIWARGLAEQRDTRVALLATWFAGPSGLVVDAALRVRGRRR